MIIDVHTHAFADDIASSAMPALEAEAGFPGSFDGTIDGLQVRMDEAGIDVAVVQPVATRPSQVSKINDWAAAACSDRIIVFGAMHPDLDGQAAEISRMAEMGLRGFKMHPEYQAFVPDEPRMASLYAAAEAQGLIVLFHAGKDIARATLRGTPATFARVNDAYPGLKMILAHMGGYDLWAEVAKHLVGRDILLDTSFTLGHLSDDRFMTLVRDHGYERVLFGTDAPWTTPVTEIAKIRALPLSDDELEAILGGNSRTLLGL